MVLISFLRSLYIRYTWMCLMQRHSHDNTIIISADIFGSRHVQRQWCPRKIVYSTVYQISHCHWNHWKQSEWHLTQHTIIFVLLKKLYLKICFILSRHRYLNTTKHPRLARILTVMSLDWKSKLGVRAYHRLNRCDKDVTLINGDARKAV